MLILTAKANSSERKDFVNEIEMMKTVAKGGNPHVVGLIGCEEPLCLIIEYLKYGDLRAYLHSIKEEVNKNRILVVFAVRVLVGYIYIFMSSCLGGSKAPPGTISAIYCGNIPNGCDITNTYI